MITLEQLLKSRDRRFAFQQKLLEEYPGSTVVCFTVQLPGPQKRSALSAAIAKAGLEALDGVLGPVFETRDLETGFEAYYLVRKAPLEVKRLCCKLEGEHPLGRLMDIDVIGPQGPVSRTELGLEERRCLLCVQPARVCMRARSHTTEELLRKIEQMVYDL